MPAFLLFLFAIAATEVWGHGRVQTSIAADVGEGKAIVTIRAAVVDLIVVGGLAYDAVSRLPPEERSDLLRPHLRAMAGRFRLIDEKGVSLEPDLIRLEPRDFSGEAFFSASIDQEQMTAVLEYPLPFPPASLVFWQSFGEGPGNAMYPTGHYHSPEGTHAVDEMATVPIYVVLTIRQEGELVLLPCELGPGFPVRFPFLWSRKTVPLAHRRSLRGATCGWENRPASGRLTVDETRVTWKVCLPLESLAHALPGGFPDFAESTWLGLRDLLAERVSLFIDGKRAEPGGLRMSVHPMSAVAMLEGRELAAGSDRPGMVVLELSQTVAGVPREIEATWDFYSEAMPRLYAEVLRGGEIADFSILCGESPVLHWPE